MIVRLHHVQITVPVGAEAQAREFYCGLLGLIEIDKPESLRARGGFWVELREIDIYIGVEDGINRSGSKGHLAYQVDELPRWRHRLGQEPDSR